MASESGGDASERKHLDVPGAVLEPLVHTTRPLKYRLTSGSAGGGLRVGDVVFGQDAEEIGTAALAEQVRVVCRRADRDCLVARLKR